MNPVGDGLRQLFCEVVDDERQSMLIVSHEDACQ
jgi:hypothetical protein